MEVEFKNRVDAELNAKAWVYLDNNFAGEIVKLSKDTFIWIWEDIRVQRESLGRLKTDVTRILKRLAVFFNSLDKNQISI